MAFKHCSQPRNLDPLSCRGPFSDRSDLQKPGFDNSSRCSAGSSAVPTRAVGAIGHIGQQKNNMLLVICRLMIDTENARKEANPFLDPSKYFLGKYLKYNYWDIK